MCAKKASIWYEYCLQNNDNDKLEICYQTCIKVYGRINMTHHIL